MAERTNDCRVDRWLLSSCSLGLAAPLLLVAAPPLPPPIPRLGEKLLVSQGIYDKKWTGGELNLSRP